LVRQAAEPVGFGAFELNFGEDSTGAPAVWISFFRDPTYPTAAQDIKRLTGLGRKVKSKLFKSHINRVPYVRFRQGSAAAG
jgi:hypothetical protein